MVNREYIQEINEVFLGKKEQDSNLFYSDSHGYIIKTSQQEIKILISAEQQCCENSGYFCANDSMCDFIGAELLKVKLTNTCLNTKVFETKDELRWISEDCIQFVDLITDKGTLQFAVYNNHNGYYGHQIFIGTNKFSHKEYL